MKKLIVFNWKMAPDSLKEAKRLFNAVLNSKSYILNSEIVIAPSFVHLPDLLKSRKFKSKVALGAQDVFWTNPPAGGGAYTGEISAKMLKNLGVEYVIIGHSERRQWLGETDEVVNKKVLTVLKTGLKVVLCVGEDLSVRKRGKEAAENFIKNQLEKNLPLNSKSYILNSRLIIAYEPIWAIGTGRADTPENAAEMARFIKKTLNSKFYPPAGGLNSRVLYGGSVNSRNAKSYLDVEYIDGLLIGGASLKTSEVKKILEMTTKSAVITGA